MNQPLLTRTRRAMGIVASALLVLSLSAGVAARPASAATSASLKAGPLTLAHDGSGDVTSDITLTSTDQAVSAATLHLTVTNLRYVDSVFTSSVFTTELKPVNTSSAGVLTFGRIRLDKGYTGSDGLIGQLIFAPTTTGTASISIDQSSSSLVAYSDATNILSGVNNTSSSVKAATPVASAKPAAVPATMTQTDTDESGMSMTAMQTKKSSYFQWPHKGDTLGYARVGLLVLGLILLLMSAISWLRLRKRDGLSS